MSEARDRILAAISAALNGGGRRDPGACRERLAHPAAPAPPAWNETPSRRFRRLLLAADASVEELPGLKAVPAVAAAYLAQRGLAPRLWLSEAPELRTLDWSGLTIDRGGRQPDSPAALAVAFRGVAETGSLALISEAHQATGLHFLAEHHLVVLRDAHILTRLEALWAALRTQPGFPPRSVNLITGPSRTADIEQTIQLGAHGPRHLHVFLCTG